MLKIQQIIKNRLLHESNIQLCILYGSAAKDRLTERSDIDIAVSGYNTFDLHYLVHLQSSLSLLLEREVDLVDMNRAEGLILQHILKGEVLIKKDAAVYADFIRKVIYFNADILPNIRMILKKRARRFISGY